MTGGGSELPLRIRIRELLLGSVGGMTGAEICSMLYRDGDPSRHRPQVRFSLERMEKNGQVCRAGLRGDAVIWKAVMGHPVMSARCESRRMIFLVCHNDERTGRLVADVRYSLEAAMHEIECLIGKNPKAKCRVKSVEVNI